MSKYETAPTNTGTTIKRDSIPISLQRVQNSHKVPLPANIVDILNSAQNAKHNFAVVNKGVEQSNPKLQAAGNSGNAGTATSAPVNTTAEFI